MKNLKIHLILFLVGITLFSCTDDGTETPTLLIDNKLSIIKIDGKEKTRFYYENDKLVELQTDFSTWDSINQVSVPQTAHRFFEYGNDRLTKVVHDGGETNIEYIENDMIISKYHHQSDDAIMTFKNYQDLENLRVDQFVWEGYHPKFNPTFSDDGNFLFALDDVGNALEDTYPGYYYLSPYYDIFTYNNMKSQYKNFEREVQFYLYQKPFNNAIASIDKGGRKVEYEYEFNTDGFPISSQAISIYANANDPAVMDTFVHSLKEYIYE